MLSSVSSVEEKVQFRQYVSLPVLSMSVVSMQLLSMLVCHYLCKTIYVSMPLSMSDYLCSYYLC